MLGYIIVGFLAGTISGMGIGGGVLLIPALGLFFGMSQQAAQSINLLYFIPTASIAILTHRKNGNIVSHGMVKLALFGLIGAALGAILAMWIDPNLLKRIFGFFLLIMGIIEIRKKDRSDKNGTNSLRKHESTFSRS